VNKGIVLSLCDRTGVMVQPWQKAGYRCVIVDKQHECGVHQDGELFRIGCDVRDYNPTALPIAIVFAFPPCTHLANSGNRYKAGKGLGKLIEALQLVEACRAICEASNAPWMLENPVGSLSTYWRKPDFTFHPWEYTTPKEKKRTCIWAGKGFIMPQREVPEEPPDVRESCWKAPPSPDRGDIRSVTPEGFARAVFQANEPLIREHVA
jgi:hypothetical protein